MSFVNLVPVVICAPMAINTGAITNAIMDFTVLSQIATAVVTAIIPKFLASVTISLPPNNYYRNFRFVEFVRGI